MYRDSLWPTDKLEAIADPAARNAVASLLFSIDEALERVQVRDLNTSSPDDDSALMEAYIGLEDLTSALLAAWYADDTVNDGLSSLERLIQRTRQNS